MEADLSDVVATTVTVNEYVNAVSRENGASMNFEGSRDDEAMDGEVNPPCVVRLHEYSNDCVDVEPSQSAMNALAPTNSVEDLDCTKTRGPGMVTVGTTKFSTTTVTRPWAQFPKKLHMVTVNVYELDG